MQVKIRKQLSDAYPIHPYRLVCKRWKEYIDSRSSDPSAPKLQLEYLRFSTETAVMIPLNRRTIITYGCRKSRLPDSDTLLAYGDHLEVAIDARRRTAQLLEPAGREPLFKQIRIREIILQLDWSGSTQRTEAELPFWRQHIPWLLDALSHSPPATQLVKLEHTQFPEFISDRFLRFINSREPALQQVKTPT